MIGIVLGTRPEIIKTAPIVLEAQRRGIEIGIIHTGQHYTPSMDEIFFKGLGLPQPAAHAHVGSMSAARQLGCMMDRLATIFEELKPTTILVQGDTNSVLAGALTAEKMGLPVAHLEAGLRSDDRTMPEEINRILTDHLSCWLFCPTELQRDRLKQEGIDHAGVSVTGNSIVDAVMHFAPLAKKQSSILNRLDSVGTFALLTMHRPSNVDDPQRLRDFVAMLSASSRGQKLPIVFPVHPRTRAALQKANIELPTDVFITMEPLGFIDMLALEQAASIILTDSGGIQEEACILGIPCITLRANTERPETITVGANVLYDGTQAKELIELIQRRMSKASSWNNPFGDGKTAQRVLDILQSYAI